MFSPLEKTICGKGTLTRVVASKEKETNIINVKNSGFAREARVEHVNPFQVSRKTLIPLKP